MARRKRSSPRRRRRRNPTSHRRRRRSNIGFKPKKILGTFKQGVMDAAGVIGGKAATRIVANFLPLPKDGMILNFAVQGLSAIIVGMVAQQVFGGNTARMMIAGGFSAPVESLMSGLPFIGPMLGDDQLLYGDYLMGQVDLPIGDTGEYPEIGEYVEEAPMGQVDLPIGEDMGEYVEY